MADAGDLKSLVGNNMSVRVRQGPLEPEKAGAVVAAPPNFGPESRVDGQAAGQDPGQSESPRGALLAALANAVRDAAAPGDLVAARVAHGRLLIESDPARSWT